MDLDVTIQRGQGRRLAVIFVHGLGMDKHFWIDPLGTKVFGRSVSMSVLAARKPRDRKLTDTFPRSALKRFKGITIGTIPRHRDNLWEALADKGFHLVCWSQRRPAGPMHAAVDELQQVMKVVRQEFPGMPVALVCHSRGGLIARKVMERKNRHVRALVTLATPHQGSSLSRLGAGMAPLAPFLKKLLPAETHGVVSDVLGRLQELITGNALKELMPGSDFFHGLKDSFQEGVRYLSFGGNRTDLFTVYKWVAGDRRVSARPLITIPDSLLRVVPESVIPDEIISGKGDFLVSSRSAVLPWTSEHYTVHANHVTITWNKKVMRIIEGALDCLEGDIG